MQLNEVLVKQETRKKKPYKDIMCLLLGKCQVLVSCKK